MVARNHVDGALDRLACVQQGETAGRRDARAGFQKGSSLHPRSPSTDRGRLTPALQEIVMS
jgi:hypothetical protein